MTQFIDTTKEKETKKEKKETVFTAFLEIKSNGAKWWQEFNRPTDCKKVFYLGKCHEGSEDIFSVDNGSGIALIYKGIKGDEFND